MKNSDINIKITSWTTDATQAPEGAVNISGGISFSHPAGGCGSPGCKCSPGWWISIALPVDSAGLVRGLTLTFPDGVRSMRDFLSNTRDQMSEWLDRPF